MTKAGTEQQPDPLNYTFVKQSNILAWKQPNAGYEHVTIATYKDSYGWHIIHSNAYTYKYYNQAVYEELIPNWYRSTFKPPSVYYWNFIERGN